MHSKPDKKQFKILSVLINLRASNKPDVLMKESGSNDTIQHDGTVKKVDGNSVLVSITSNPACSGCHAEGLCGISGKEEKIIDIRGITMFHPVIR